jgi:hypothetical protein
MKPAHCDPIVLFWGENETLHVCLGENCGTGNAQKAHLMSFGTKQAAAPLRPLVLAHQANDNARAQTPPNGTPTLVHTSRARQFANATAVTSTTSLPRLKQQSALSKGVSFIVSTIVICAIVFGVVAWAGNGKIPLPGTMSVGDNVSAATKP